MSPARLQSIEQLFERAVQIPAESRGEFLSTECGDDHELRTEVENLLRHADVPTDMPAWQRAARAAVEILDEDPLWNATRPVRLPEIPGYEVLERVSQGGMGVIFKARHLGLNRSVALKMIATPLAADAEVQARFRNEISALARLHHPHVVQIFDVGEAGGHAYFAMEYVDGPNLAKVIGGRPQPPRLAARLAVCLARTIADVHAVGLLHRDLKPGNVLLAPPSAGMGRSDAGVGRRDVAAPHELQDDESPESVAAFGEWSSGRSAFDAEMPASTRHLAVGTPKIGDFGLALALDADSRLTRTGSLGGTPQYVAPEQLHGAPESLTIACDIYSLGAVLYEMLTGRPPFTGHSPHEIARQVAEAEPLALRRLQPQLPLDLETIVLKCLRKSPEQRYASATELAEDLERYLAGTPILARRVRLPERVLRWIGMRPWKAVMAGVATLALAALAADFVKQTIELKETLSDIASERERARRSERAALAEVRELRQANSLLDAQLRDSKQLIDSTARRLRAVVPSTSFGEAYLDVRREVLEAVSDYHSRFAARFPAGNNATLEQARASLLLAELRCDEGRYEESHELLTDAAERFSGELRRHRFEASFGLAETALARANCEVARRRPDAAAPYFRDAISILGSLVESTASATTTAGPGPPAPDSASFELDHVLGPRRRLIQAYARYATLLWQRQEFAEASRMLARAAEQMTPLLANHSDDVSMTREFAAYRGFAGRAFEKLDHWEAAHGAYAEASRLLSRVIVADSASEQDFATHHARCDQTIAMLKKLDRVGEIVDVAARSLDALERACERFPNHRLFRDWRDARSALLERLTLERLTLEHP